MYTCLHTIYAFIHSSIHPVIHSCFFAFMHSSIHAFIHPFIRSCRHAEIDSSFQNSRDDESKPSHFAPSFHLPKHTFTHGSKTCKLMKRKTSALNLWKSGYFKVLFISKFQEVAQKWDQDPSIPFKQTTST